MRSKRTGGGLTTDHPRTARDRRELSSMLAGVFARRHDFLERHFLCDIESDPGVEPEQLRVVRKGGRIVAHVGFYRKTVRVGRASVDMGGLAAVACLPEHRGAGLAGRCLTDALRLMRDEGLRISILFGIGNFYGRFGYVGCIPRYQLRVHCEDLNGLVNHFDVAPYDPRRLDDLVRLYAEASAETPLAAERDRRQFAHAIRTGELSPTGRAGDDPPMKLFREKRGSRKVRAYVVWRDGELVEAAVAPGDTEACEAVLAWMRALRVAALEKDVRLASLCPAHPLWRHTLRYTHTSERVLSWTGAGMGQILDVRGFVEDMRPEFERRVDAAGIVAECHLHLAVDGRDHSVILCRSHHITNAGANVVSATVHCSRGDLLQMSLGTLSYRVIPGVVASGATSLLEALFCERSPQIYRLDHF